MSGPDRAPSERELRWFGLLMLVVFGVLGGVAWWQLSAEGAARTLFSIGLALAALYYAVRPLRRPLHALWMHATWPLGQAVSHLVLAVVFYGILTPVALSMRLFGRDKLERRFEPDADSYWVSHDPSGDPARYLRQS